MNDLLYALLYILSNQAVVGGVAILFVLAVRWLLTLLPRRAPRYIVCLLWLVVAVRLVCPFSTSSPVGLLDTNRPVSEDVLKLTIPAETYTPIPNESTVPVEPDTPSSPITTPPTGVKGDVQINTLALLMGLWAIGTMALLLHGGIGWYRLRRRVREAIPEETPWGRIYRCTAIKGPFVLGLFRPRLYVPATLPEAELRYVVAHEQAHIRRGDPWYKWFAYLLLAVYWFQPLCWLAFRLLCRDLELACDERVMKTLGDGADAEKKAYSSSMLGCAARGQGLAFCPVAFGGTDVKTRIRHVLRYKKPALWLSITAVVLCAVAGLAVLTTRPSTGGLTGKEIGTLERQLSHDNHETLFGNLESYTALHIYGTENTSEGRIVYVWMYTSTYTRIDDVLYKQNGSSCPIVLHTTGEGYEITITDMESPNSGMFYSPSVKEIFPLYAWLEMQLGRHPTVMPKALERQIEKNFVNRYIVSEDWLDTTREESGQVTAYTVYARNSDGMPSDKVLAQGKWLRYDLTPTAMQSAVQGVVRERLAPNLIRVEVLPRYPWLNQYADKDGTIVLDVPCDRHDIGVGSVVEIAGENLISQTYPLYVISPVKVYPVNHDNANPSTTYSTTQPGSSYTAYPTTTTTTHTIYTTYSTSGQQTIATTYGPEPTIGRTTTTSHH